MKKNKALTAAISVLSLTMVSMCAIGGTFAKYVSNGSATETAKVAKWGVEVTAETYVDDNLEADLTTAENEIITSVSSADLLAPGTGIKFASINITGQPEVDVKVTYKATLNLENFGVTGDEHYCPLAFKVNEEVYKYEGDIDTVAELKKAVEDAIAAYTKSYDAGTVLSSVSAEELTVSCYWAFEAGANADEIAANDAKDKLLGDKATTENAPTISLTITATVTQVD